MTKAEVWKLRPADLRRIAAKAEEPERARKMLALAEQLETVQNAGVATTCRMATPESLDAG